MAVPVVAEDVVPTLQEPKKPGIPSWNMTIVGRGACGKTSILVRFAHGVFDPKITATSIESRNIEFPTAYGKIPVRAFDTSGQDDYARFRALTLPISDFIIICYSLIDPSSYADVMDTLHYMVKEKKAPLAKVILCATKMDMRDKNSPTTAEGMQLAQQIGAAKYCECSALTDEGIAEIYKFIQKGIEAEERKRHPGFCARLFCCA